ncbi:hypothetical protein BG015_002070 [Linnemannia schmuckeri]|uniref:Uncharacterized protein n=1 Tax=Linnemannia schmuckeri TaxID=64567 RepID=A0A9P5RSC9_9FUNG|nr:hypothetical protein BG015_002070 [Linnemannia schmuckeri]
MYHMAFQILLVDIVEGLPPPEGHIQTKSAFDIRCLVPPPFEFRNKTVNTVLNVHAPSAEVLDAVLGTLGRKDCRANDTKGLPSMGPNRDKDRNPTSKSDHPLWDAIIERIRDSATLSVSPSDTITQPLNLDESINLVQPINPNQSINPSFPTNPSIHQRADQTSGPNKDAVDREFYKPSRLQRSLCDTKQYYLQDVAVAVSNIW